ncbi:unnamed protein product [Adineta ricciae]|uniref:Sema domain-containing protein n=1 Tax=Adineta ricciae TaxID=249248 RepID=A0A815X3U2_ADIRI|nr:unnamed protein product [Adineta ricciae]
MVVFYLLLLVNICSIIAENELQFVSYNASLQTMRVHRNGDEAFDAIVVDEEQNQIIIGAKNAITRLSLDDFHVRERFVWESQVDDANICRNQVKLVNECENYIRVLALRPRDRSLLVCGTNAYHPICTWRRSDSLSTLVSNENLISGDGKSPFNSHYTAVYHLIETGEFYSATNNEPVFGIQDSLIQRSFSQTKQLRTQQHDSNWLKNPYFVRILSIKQYIYTFFREIALEHLSCGTNIYSRVARICKYDDGTMKYSDTFRSFSKLRIQCSKKSSNEVTSFDFNELQSISFDPSSNLIYAAFNLPKHGLVGSAICVYTVEELENMFKSPFLIQKSNESFWLPHPAKQETESCDASGLKDESMTPLGPVLRSGVLQPSFNALVLDNIHIGHLLVDQLNGITVLFVITLDGLWLRKYSLLSDQTLCLLEQIDLKPPMISIENWKINKAEMIAKTKEIVITTHTSVLKIPVARCDRLKTNEICSASMDPYCTWDNSRQRCVFSKISSLVTSSENFKCPNLDIISNGGWTSWSNWFACEQETGEKCQCRTRTCTQAKGRLNATLCQGQRIEMSQCEIHGGWSSWSAWSSCPQVCGKFLRSRTRTCTNPSPRNHGRVCIGLEREEDWCPEIICSSDSSRLSVWSEWSQCSKSCGGGIQKRTRTCLVDNEKCHECLQETRPCNQHSCPVEQAILWSNWTQIRSNDEMSSDDIKMESRTRFVCSMMVNQTVLHIKSDQTMFRVCDNERNDCQEKESLGQWSQWSDWGECYPSCGTAGSVQTRRRQCMDNQCFGKEVEKRDCSICPSHPKSNWSCWSDWSQCSACNSFQFYSTKYRTRLCLTNSCAGLSREERACSCPFISPFFDQYRFTLIQTLFTSLISFLFGCLLSLSVCALYKRRYSSSKSYQRNFAEYLRESTSNSSSSPRTAIDSDTFTTLSNHNQTTMKFRSFDSSGYFKDIPSRKLNLYMNPRDIPPSPPQPTLKRTSIMSSMKTNLDADDL